MSQILIDAQEEVKFKTRQVVSLASDVWEKYWNNTENVDVHTLLEISNLTVVKSHQLDDNFSVYIDPKVKRGVFVYPAKYDDNSMYQNLGLAHLLGRYVCRYPLPYSCTLKDCYMTDVVPKVSLFQKIKYWLFKQDTIVDAKEMQDRVYKVLCNIFAVSLLIPQEAYQERFSPGITTDEVVSIESVSESFHVPIELVRIFF
jgi:hypothetical protein